MKISSKLHQKSVKNTPKIITRFLSKSGVPRNVAIILLIFSSKFDQKSAHFLKFN